MDAHAHTRTGRPSDADARAHGVALSLRRIQIGAVAVEETIRRRGDGEDKSLARRNWDMDPR